MTHDDDSLRTPYRSVRPVTAPADGPWAGMLTRLGSGESRVLVDAATLGGAWLGWRAAPDGHVLAPLDVVRRRDGHDVALPVCADRVVDFLTRRASAGLRLSAGEAVTLGVSLLRGCSEVLDQPTVVGEWWLTESGRPVLATESGAQPAVAGAASLLSQLEACAPDARAWNEAIAAVTSDRALRSELERAEHELFRIADPVPLLTAPSVTRSARDLTTFDRMAVAMDESGPRAGIWHQLVRYVDGDLADLVSRASVAAWRRTRAPREKPSSRRRPILVGGAAAVAVLAIGLMWPAEGPDPITAGAAEQAPATASPTPQATQATDTPDETSGSVPAGSDDDLAVIAAGLLDRRLACADDPVCLEGVTLNPGLAYPPGAIDQPASGRSIVLLDDFGGLAVLRVDAAGEPQESQLVVIVRSDDEWLLRDVHDAAQQP